MNNPQWSGPDRSPDPPDRNASGFGDGWNTVDPYAAQSPPYAPTELSPVTPPSPGPSTPGYVSSDPYLSKDPYGSNPPLSPVVAPGSGAQYGPAYGAYYGGGYPAYPQYVPSATQTSGKSTTALVCGIVCLVSVFVLSCVSIPVAGPTGIVALVMGVKARREIADSGGTQTGSGNALAGMITGGIGLGISVVATICFIIWIVVVAASTY